MVTDMAEWLDAGALKLALLNAIPEKQMRDYVGRPPRRLVLHGLAHEDAYAGEFGDANALEYLDVVRMVVLGQDAPRDAANRAELEEKFAAFARKTAGVPGDYAAILDVFAKWYEATRVVGGGRPEAGGGGGDQGLAAKLEALKTLTLS
jgi:hypothetical protein